MAKERQRRPVLSITQQAEMFKKLSNPAVKYATDIVIKTPDVYAEAMTKAQVINTMINQRKERFAPLITDAKSTLQGIRQLEADVLEPLKIAKARLAPKLLKFSDDLELAAEKERLKAEADAKAKQDKLDKAAEKKAEKAKDKGDTDGAEKIMNTVPQVPVAPPKVFVPKVGRAYKKVTYKAEVTNAREYIKHVMTLPDPENYLLVNMRPLNDLSKSTEGKAVKPGIRFFKDKTMVPGSA